jgi:hypothetical protein
VSRTRRRRRSSQACRSANITSIEALTGLVIGAVLTFLASAYASLILKRFETREEARRRILTDLLPPLWRVVLSETRSPEQLHDLKIALNDLRWTALIAGPRETAFGVHLNELASKWSRALEGSEPPGGSDPFTVDLSSGFDATCSDFHDYLVGRLQRPWWNPF